MANKDNSPFMGNIVYLVMGTSNEEHNYKKKTYSASYQIFLCERCDVVFPVYNHGYSSTKEADSGSVYSEKGIQSVKL